ncbi:MAG: hypothetical protein QXV17_08880, partial [Candidatus Micrarchaeaceae archaeon]
SDSEFYEKLKDIGERKNNAIANKQVTIDWQQDSTKSLAIIEAIPTTTIDRYVDGNKVYDVYKVYGEPKAVGITDTINIRGDGRNLAYLKLRTDISDIEEILDEVKDKQKEEYVVDSHYVLTDGENLYIYNSDRIPKPKTSLIYKELADNQEYHQLLSLYKALKSVIASKQEGRNFDEEAKKVDEKFKIKERYKVDISKPKALFELLNSTEKQLADIFKPKAVALMDISKGFAKVGKTLLLRSASVNGLFNMMPVMKKSDLESYISKKPIIVFARNIDISNPNRTVFSPAIITTTDGNAVKVNSFSIIRNVTRLLLYGDKQELDATIPKNFDFKLLKEYIDNLSPEEKRGFYRVRGLPIVKDIEKAYENTNIDTSNIKTARIGILRHLTDDVLKAPGITEENILAKEEVKELEIQEIANINMDVNLINEEDDDFVILPDLVPENEYKAQFFMQG